VTGVLASGCRSRNGRWPSSTPPPTPSALPIPLKAAALLHSIADNRALVDGNQRLAWLATVVFLDLNTRSPGLSDDEAFDLVQEVAGSSLDVGEIACRPRAAG
jgi:death-on-curing protein